MSKLSSKAISRRQLLFAAGTGAVVAAGAVVSPRSALATTEEADKLQSELTGGAAATESRVTLKLPAIAENGNTVPFTVSVDSPMTADDYVKQIHVMAEGNPSPAVVSYNLTPECGKAQIRLFMRLAKTQDVRAIAVMNDGSVFTAKSNIKVTIGGCGG